MKSQKVLHILVAILLVSSILIGCAPQATPTEAPTAPPAAAPTQAIAATEAPAAAPTEAPPAEKKLKVAFVLPGSISDGSFVTMAYQAIQEVKQQPFIEEVTYIEGINAATDAAKAIRDYVAEGYDVVWAHSGVHAAAVMEIAPQFPDTTFVALASPPADKKFDNVWFSGGEYEGAYYVAGALAAKMTKSNVIGFIGGRENPLYKACSLAYEEGAKSINPDIQVLAVFTGDFNDPVKGKEAAVSQIQSGADVIAHAMNLGAFGLFAAAEEAEAAGETQIWTIGKDMDQFAQAPKVVLTSIIIDNAIQMKLILGEIAAGNRTGFMPMNLEKSSVYLADFYGQVPPEVIAEIEAIQEKVLKGEVEYTTQYDLAQ